MKLCAIFFVILLHLETSHCVDFKEKWIEQYIDHFNFEVGSMVGKRTFKQRYLVQDKWWSPGKGPIFFYSGNEGPIEVFWNNCGFLMDIAPQFEALVIFGEHRYYGKSLPFGEDSFRTPYVGFLSIEQALADFAYMITQVKQDLNANNSSVITFGGSYGGILSAYLRFKYPNIVDGAIAASAPVYTLAGFVPRSLFFKDVTLTFSKSGSSCVTGVRKAFQIMDHLADKQELATLSRIFKTCQPLKTLNDYKHLLGWIRNSFTNLAMFDYPYPTSVVSQLPAYPVKVVCEAIMMSLENVLPALAYGAGLYYNGTAGNMKCFDIYKEFVSCADPTGCGTGNDASAWDYQACTDMLLPGGSNGVSDMFPELPFNLSDRSNYCKATWNITTRNDWLSINMFGAKIALASNIVFSNGELDPWRGGGVNHSLSDSLISVYIEGGAHHLDLRSRNENDPLSVRKARDIELSYINKWIN